MIAEEDFRGLTSRRAVVRSLAGLASLAVAPAFAVEPNRGQFALGLRELATERGVAFGAAAVSNVLRSDPAMAAIYTHETTMIVADYEMKWGVVRPSPATYVYDGADYLVDFAAKNNITMRGHCLAWEESNPAWMNATINRQNAEKYLVDHIERLVGRYSGRIKSWDVVNEPIWPDHGKPGGLRDGVWLRTLGPQYIDTSFRAARAADSSAMLVLNEAATEVTSPAGLRTRQHFLDLLDRLKRDNVPVDAVGLECHLSTKSAFDGNDFGRYLTAISDRGFKILISELDVSDADEPSPDIAARDDAVARLYDAVARIALQNPATVAILTWELADKYSYMREAVRPDGTHLRPLPFDRELQRKPCWQALANAFSAR
ncbi:endo-1,4-beta-xylanase [Bradyrhizobium sp. USDA 4449]